MFALLQAGEARRVPQRQVLPGNASQRIRICGRRIHAAVAGFMAAWARHDSEPSSPEAGRGRDRFGII